MFTGIIEQIGDVVSCDRDGAVLRLIIRAILAPLDLAVGGSVAVNGCCLTATEISDDAISFDLGPETVARTRFDQRLVRGKAVNLERPLRLSSRIDGHFVQGHVDGLGTVLAVRETGQACEMSFALPRELIRYCAQKGSIAIDGVSLTCAHVDGASVSVALIPHTLAITTLGRLKAGDLVNVEVDIMAKYVEKLLPK